MIHRRTDYRPPAFVIDQVALDVQIAEQTLVTARLSMRRAAASGTGRARDTGLRLDARALQVVSVAIDDQPLPAGAWTLDDHALHIAEVPDQFTLTTVTRLQPEANTALEGFYQSGPMYCTQCEAHGFSRITPYLDRPDVLSRFTVRLQADAARFPVLLANGNCIERGALAGGQHYARWEDPYAKPCYLFAMVAGDLAKVADTFRAADGRDIALEFFVDHGNENRVAHAMASLKDAMRWDEQRFGLVYDLDVYMIVAARAFNMGAMENKGLNIFNAAYVLATPDTATDESFEAISAVIAPTVNSYKRLVRKGAMSGSTWAPVFVCYGNNNRTNMLRIPSQGGRVECRAADIACNPYLGAAMILAAGLEGIREAMDPGQPHRENMYNYSDKEVREMGIEMLPQNLGEAIDAFEADPLSKQVFGEAMFESFVQFKREEWTSYHTHVSEWEIQRYLKFF